MGGRAFQTLIALALAGFWGALLGAQHLAGGAWLLDRVEATTTDMRMALRGVRQPPGGVAIIAIDDAMAAREGSYPIGRAALAEIVERVRELAPRAIAIDMLLVDRGPPEGDAALAKALAGGPTVIAAAAVFAKDRQDVPGMGHGPLSEVPEADSFLMPQSDFGKAAAVGVVNVATDESGTPRFLPMLFRTGDRLESSFPLRAASLAAGQDAAIQAGQLTLAGRTIRTDIGEQLPLAFYGPRGTIPTYSAADILAGRVPAADIAGRIAVIGATVTGGGDVFPTPFDPVMPGVEVISTGVSHLINGDGLRRDRPVRLLDAGLAVALPMIVVGLLTWRRSVVALAAIAAVTAAWLAFNLAAFAQGIWMSLALPMAAAVPPAILYGAAQLWLDRRRAQYFAGQSALLQQFQAPGLGDWLASHSDFLAKPLRCEAAVIFIDLSGFTGVSEMMLPSGVRELLNTFQATVANEVVASGGVITGFAGDGAMILFGLPEPSVNDAPNAARCCVRLAETTRSWLASLSPPTAARIGFKIGAHFGPMVASRLGGAGHQHITATGDTVNVASRLMEVAAANSADVAASDEFVQAAGLNNALSTTGLLSGPVERRVRGRASPLLVWTWLA